MNKVQKILILILFIRLQTNDVYGQKIYAYIDSVDCSKYNPNYIKVLKCWVVPMGNGNTKAMNGFMDLKQDLTSIHNHYRIVVEWASKNVTYISLEFDICTDMTTFFQNPLMRLLSQELRQVSNFPLECPLRMGLNYTMTNFTINSRYLPRFAPKIKWIGYSYFYTDASKKVMLLQHATFGRLDTTAPEN